jgi:hypothetical protein
MLSRGRSRPPLLNAPEVGALQAGWIREVHWCLPCAARPGGRRAVCSFGRQGRTLPDGPTRRIPPARDAVAKYTSGCQRRSSALANADAPG